jgi:regulator of protease activity HflC (stomatin/prohibitin superfamily)
MKGRLRSIIGKRDIESLLRERDQFNKKVVQESAED